MHDELPFCRELAVSGRADHVAILISAARANAVYCFVRTLLPCCRNGMHIDQAKQVKQRCVTLELVRTELVLLMLDF
jgi:hypothetical protein